MININKKYIFLTLAIIVTGYIILTLVSNITSNKPHASVSNITRLSVSNVTWSALNPVRGDASPSAGMLWGDRNRSGPSGFLVKFKDGFSSPPHSHNVTYRGIVIEGSIHNADPRNELMWMPSGSFWTQPAGDIHITAAKGEHNVIYVEIDEGPYLVQPINDTTNSTEVPINIDRSNIVWLDASDISWLTHANKKASVSFLWGQQKEGNLHGSLLKLPTGVSGYIQSEASIFNAIIIQGQLHLKDTNHIEVLKPGSYFTLNNQSINILSSHPNDDTIIYIRTNSTYKLY